jgi:hypothetical protein
VKPHKTAQKHGIGLYTYEQEKYVTPFQYFAHIVVGTIVASTGAMLGYGQYQSPNPRTLGFVGSATLVVIGIFQAHAGAIFWYRRLKKRKHSN